MKKTVIKHKLYGKMTLNGVAMVGLISRDVNDKNKKKYTLIQYI
jgi:hypothetical protein